MRPLLAAALILGMAAPAAAQDSAVFAEGDEAADEWAYDRPDVRLVTDFSFFSGAQVVNGMDTTYFGMGIVVAGQVRVWEDLWIDATWGFPHGSFSMPTDPFPTGGGGTRVGNPYVGASYVIDARPARLTFGLGVTIPLSETPEVANPMDYDNLAKSVADSLVSRMEGNVRPWLYLPDTLSIVARGRAESVGPLLWAADIVIAPMIATSDTGVYSGDTELLLVPAAEIGWRAYPWLSVGLRGQVAIFPTEADETMGSVEPFIEAAKPNVGHFRLGFLMHLGGANGSTFDDNGLWAIRLTTGVLF